MLKPSKFSQPNNNETVEKLLPVVLSFGPVFMCFGLEGIATSRGAMALAFHILALLGVGSLSWGLSQLLIRQKRILQRLAELATADSQ